MSGKQYFGGLPTGPDVKLLIEHWPAVQERQEFSHAEVERVLKIKNGTSRYRTVTTAWRKQLFRYENIFIDAVPGVGFKCLDPKARVENGIKTFQRGTREHGKSINRLRYVPHAGLDDISKAKLEHVVRLGVAIHAQAKEVMRELPKPQAQITQIRRPPDGKKSA